MTGGFVQGGQVWRPITAAFIASARLTASCIVRGGIIRLRRVPESPGAAQARVDGSYFWNVCLSFFSILSHFVV